MSDYGQLIGLGITAAGTGASIASGIEGKNAQERNARLLRDLAGNEAQQSQALLETTAPLRLGVTDTLASVLAGGRPTNMRVFAPERETLEAQFRNARNAIINTTPARGGQLNRLLASLEGDRASAVTGLESDVRNRAFQLAGQIGFQVPGTSFAATQGASNTFAQLAQMGASQASAAGAGLGQMAGMAAVMALKNGQRTA